MTTPLNPLATIKELGAIEWRINDANLDSHIRAACIRRNLDNLIDTTPRKFHGIILGCSKALEAGDYLELVAGLALIRSMVPTTYGMTPAGTAFSVTNGGNYIKRKNGIEELHTTSLFKHLPADTHIHIINH